MGDPTASPDAVTLRAALERLVLLECRAQLNAGPTSAAVALELERWRAEAQRAEARAATAEAQRDRLFTRVMEAERLHASAQATGAAEGSSADAGVDLASFIAELRSELARLEQGREAADRERAELLRQLRAREGTPHPEAGVESWVDRFSAQGLIPDPQASLGALERDLLAGSPPERALLQSVLRDLSEPHDPGLREAAAERLAALPAALAAPVFAAALSREAAPEVLAKLIRGAGLTRVGSLGPLLSPLRHHPDGRVRAALLFAEVRLAPALPAEGWERDPDPRVRRRAALAAALHAPLEAEPVLSRLAEDGDAGVREAAAAGASALAPPPVGLLLRLAQDGEPRVRRAALRALSAPQAWADVPAAERRRALRELLKAQVGAEQVPRTDGGSEPPAGEPFKEAGASPVEAPAAGGHGLPTSQALEGALELELRAALRGRTSPQLAESLGAAVSDVERALAAAPERFVQRGQKWYSR